MTDLEELAAYFKNAARHSKAQAAALCLFAVAVGALLGASFVEAMAL